MRCTAHASAPVHRDRRRPHRRLRAGRLLRADGRRPGLHPEDLLPARAAGDRRAGRLRRSAAIMAIQHLRTGDRALRTCAPTSRSTCRSSSASACCITGAIWAKASWGHWWVWDEPTLVSLPDRLPPLLRLPAAALLDRGPRAPGALRLRLRGHRRRVRAAQLRRRPAGRVAHASAHARRPAATLPGGCGSRSSSASSAMALLFVTLWQLRDGRQERPRAAARAASAGSASDDDPAAARPPRPRLTA